MIYRALGKTGIKVSAFSLGSWVTFNQVDRSTLVDLVRMAFESGINLFDTAEVYGAGSVETKLGSIVHELALPREKFILCSKVFWGGSSVLECGLTRKHILEGCNNSLKRLRLEYIDLYLCHRPDPNTPIEETVIAMNMLLQQGKILYWGTSEWPKEKIIEAFYITKQLNLVPPSVEQFEYNLLNWKMGKHIFPEIQAKTGIGAMATMPLACGILTNRYTKGAVPTDSRANFKSHNYLRDFLLSTEGKQRISLAAESSKIAERLGVSPAQLALYWCLSDSSISTVILGSSKISQLKENLQVLDMYEKNIFDLSVLVELEKIFGIDKKISYEPSYEEVLRGS